MIKDKFILDACCGGRCFWFNKNHPNATYIDKRIRDNGHCPERPNHCIKPDIQMDFRAMNFPDKSFKLVVFDPPHLFGKEDKGIMCKKYGNLDKNWKEDLAKGFKECWRVLDNYGVLIFKWSESCVPLKEVLSLFKVKPLFGHPTAKSGKTIWITFMKIPENQEETLK